MFIHLSHNLPQISAVFLYFCHGNLFWYKVPKNAKNDPKIIHFLHKFIHLLYQNFGYILLTRATPMPVRLSKDSRHPRHTEFSSVCHLSKNGIFYTKINMLYCKNTKILVRVSVVQKRPDFCDFCF